MLSKARRAKAETRINGGFLSSSSATNVRRRKERAGKVLPLKETFRTTFIPERRRGPWSRRRGQTRAAGKRSGGGAGVRVATAWMLIISTTGLQEPSMLCLPDRLFTGAHQHYRCCKTTAWGGLGVWGGYKWQQKCMLNRHQGGGAC